MLKREPAKQRQSLEPTPDQQAEARRLAETVALKTKEELPHVARLLVPKRDDQPFGGAAFRIRHLLHKIGARAVPTAVKGTPAGSPDCRPTGRAGSASRGPRPHRRTPQKTPFSERAL